MTNRSKVGVFIIATFFIWIAFDVWLAKNGGPTESQVLKEWALNSTFFAFLMGFLFGHWFFPRRNTQYSAWGYGLAIWVILIAWDIWWSKTGGGFMWYRFSGLWCGLGIPAGSYLWGQPHNESPLK